MGTANDYTHTEGEGKSITYNSSIQSTIGQQKIKGQSTKSDTIYRADAIKAIEDMQDCYNGFSGTYDKSQIIGVLEEVPTAELPDTNVGDIISRQAVLNECLELAEARRNWETEEGQAEIKGIDAVMCALHDLPSAQPQRKSAYLIAPHPYGRCSNCGQLIDIRDKYNYCPMCGRRLNHG